MTPIVKWSLIALRSHLIVMAMMVFYRCPSIRTYYRLNARHSRLLLAL